MHKWIYNDVTFIYDVFQNYMTCSNQTRKYLLQMQTIDRDCIKIINRELTANLNLVKEELVNLRSGYPQLMH